MLQARRRGGTPGRIGGVFLVDVWFCLDCKIDVRDWSVEDSPKFKAIAEQIERVNEYMTSIGKSLFDKLTPVESARYENLLATRGTQLKLFS